MQNERQNRQMAKILIQVDHLSVSADLKNTPTARKILEILPIEGSANVWGEEIYFDIPLQVASEPDAREEVEIGDLGFWPAGPAFCIFFGPTPVSRGDQPRAYSPVNVFGRVVEDARQFKNVTAGAKISVTLADE
jgi:hypothetical protein